MFQYQYQYQLMYKPQSLNQHFLQQPLLPLQVRKTPQIQTQLIMPMHPLVRNCLVVYCNLNLPLLEVPVEVEVEVPPKMYL